MIVCICRALNEEDVKEMTYEEFVSDAQCRKCLEEYPPKRSGL